MQRRIHARAVQLDDYVQPVCMSLRTCSCVGTCFNVHSSECVKVNSFGLRT